MSFRYIAAKHPKDDDFPDRTYNLQLMKSLLDGDFYNVQKFDMHDEEAGPNEYVPLVDRMPNTRVGTNLLRVVVEDSVSMLFGEGHFPEIDTKNAEARKVLREWIKEADVVQKMRDAAFRGSIGSIAFRIHVSKTGRIHLEVFDTIYLTPIWNADDPDVLDGMIEKYKVTGADLLDMGYPIRGDDLKSMYWIMRHWDDFAEWWFQPWKCEDDTPEKPHQPVIDETRSVENDLGFCPWKWAKNLHGGEGDDGGCTFKPAVDQCVTSDLLMSQTSRGLKYTQDPLLLLKEPPIEQAFKTDGVEITADANGFLQPVRSANQSLAINSKDGGDAKWLEIDGSAATVVMDYVEKLRLASIEVMHGNRINPDTIGQGPRGSKALEIINGSLIALADNLRASYGERALLSILQMVLKIIEIKGSRIRINGASVAPAVANADDLSLRWASWYPPSEADKQQEIAGLANAVLVGIISRQTAVKVIAATYDIEDVAAELALIDAERAAEDARTIAMAAQVQAKETLTP